MRDALPSLVTAAIGVGHLVIAFIGVDELPVGWTLELRLIYATGMILIAIAACTWPRKE